MKIRRTIAAAATSLVCAFLATPESAAADPKCHFTGCAPAPGTVTEYFNEGSGHYFYTANGAEMAVIDGGGAGQGWVKTGFLFSAWQTLDHSRWQNATCEQAPVPCRPVYRFYAPGPNTHFFTANEAEAQLLRADRAWIPEGIAFHLPIPGAATNGRCDTSMTPVYRAYNNRWMFNDSNHRFTISASSRKNLLDRGWLDEGIAFCAYYGYRMPIDSWDFQHDGPQSVRRPEACRDSSLAGDSCIAFGNLPLPTTIYQGVPPEFAAGDPFNVRIGPAFPHAVNLGYAAASRADAAAKTFLQFPRESPTYLGVYLNSRGVGATAYTEISPYRRVKQRTWPFSPEARVFPFRTRFASEYELRLVFHLNLKPFSAAAGSAAYGASSMEFLDTRSGHRLQFNVLAYAPFEGGAEYIARDVDSGMALVATRFGGSSRFARLGGRFIDQAGTPRTGSPSFDITINAAEFRQILAAARTVEAQLSADPADYVFERFGIINETYGEGELALFIGTLTASRSPAAD